MKYPNFRNRLNTVQQDESILQDLGACAVPRAPLRQDSFEDALSEETGKAQEEAIRATVPSKGVPVPEEPGELRKWVYGAVLKFARRLKSIPGVAGLPVNDTRLWALGERWEAAYLESGFPALGVNEIPICLVGAWARTLPSNPEEAKRKIWARAKRMGIPEWLKEYKDERLSLTVQLCLAWEEANGGEGAIFKLSCRQLAEFLSQSGNDADFRMAAMYLKLLCGIGFLVLEKKGDRYQGGEASKYRIFHRGG